MDSTTFEQLVTVLRSGGVAVIRTDTLYGIVASAANQAAVERVYAAKSRDEKKSCIILVADLSQSFADQGCAFTERFGEFDEPTSMLIDSPSAPSWLLRTNDELAYRVPRIEWLHRLLERTGPLIAPSANPEGLPPATTIKEAKQYFGDLVDSYIDGGTVSPDMPPSRLIRLSNQGTIERLR